MHLLRLANRTSLAQLVNHSTGLGRLVSNRMKEIEKIVFALRKDGLSVEFRYIATKENPADAGTRGLPKDQLQSHSWWSGPKFLREPPHQWTHPVYHLYEDTSNELENVVVTSIESDTPLKTAPLIDLTRFSTFFHSRAKRVTVIALIFSRNL
ncbi:unnamed protein product [Haemonchus placei]|uniref:RT_RNaseH domain-containing protein n=1 Tax=Haemonchus placei TaxID=6290 RepID=A0A0N4WBN7_HAEPC|nr:unnamed protein product [Haemonchus placei]